ncbi:hypothetical protein D770_05920 [Flammeovirgaceae bacterium 311]|nr:hypothetical protein D770_05920 [Flammeovirgaceae bacterium 311]
MFSQTLEAQQEKYYRSDTLSFSMQLRYAFVSYGAGIEFPIRDHSFGLQAGFTALPAKGNIFNDFNVNKIVALEYKRYFPANFSSGNQPYYGSYLMFKNVNYAAPHEQDWSGDLYTSNSINLGPLIGYKWYSGKIAYVELFLGMHGGWQWGELRWDNIDPVTGNSSPSSRLAQEATYGFRLGLSVGFHATKKNVRGRNKE